LNKFVLIFFLKVFSSFGQPSENVLKALVATDENKKDYTHTPVRIKYLPQMVKKIS
jgi:hypothetical protein